ncbi:MAG: TIR domain-containing protein, partial [Pseudomonadota bacterium]|nr:TIR domain-containing protein [Pseudomonadota bacterium]
MPESSVSAFAYRAFISYSHADRAWCDWLHKALETYRVPSRLVGKETAAGTIPRRLHPIFRDRDELPSAIDLNQKVAAAMRDSAWLIVICSPRAATSRWVNEEVLAFKRMGRADRILCLIVDGEPNAADLPGRESEECFCPALRHRIDANGALTDEHTEPIAADARAGKDGKANAKLKLIAGMLDVGFDALKQREQQRRVRRMTAVTALAVIVMLVTAALAINAVVARNDAQRRQKQAEDLVGFMLGDLNDKLSQVARLDVMEAVDDKAMAYFESLPDKDVTDEALVQRAKALEKIGNVRDGQGHLPAALQSYEAAAKIARSLADMAPQNAARQIAYSRDLAWIGYTYMHQSNLDMALQSFEAAQGVLKRVGTQAASNQDLMFQLTNIYNDTGHIFETRGQLD